MDASGQCLGMSVSFPGALESVCIQAIDTQEIAILSHITDMERAANCDWFVHDRVHPFAVHSYGHPFRNLRRLAVAAQALVLKEQEFRCQSAIEFHRQHESSQADCFLIERSYLLRKLFQDLVRSGKAS